MTTPMVGRRRSRRGSTADFPHSLRNEVKRLEDLYTVPCDKLKKITDHFVNELAKGLTVGGGSIPMNPTWCMGFPTGNETGTYLALDMGGTNMRVCEIILSQEKGKFEDIQSKYKLPEKLKTGSGEDLWNYIAGCLHQFLDYHHESKDLNHVPLGFTFSFPVSQEYIDNGVLQTWTKGFDVSGVEGQDVVPPFEAALARAGLPVKMTALINDTTGTLIASAYTDNRVKIGCIFGTGCNAAYMEDLGSIPKLSHLNLPKDTLMAINCEWGAFDNEHTILPLTPYDIIVDKDSPRPGQQAFEKMISGLYLGEIFRLTLLDLHDRGHVFRNQDVTKLRDRYALDSSFLSAIEEDPYENLHEVGDLLKSKLSISATKPELEVCRKLAELIGTRAARLSACGIAAICKKKNWTEAHVGADGSVFQKYPHFKDRNRLALREIFDWPESSKDLIIVQAAEDGSGVGAALIAALTLKRAQEGNHCGIKDPQGLLKTAKAALDGFQA